MAKENPEELSKFPTRDDFKAALDALQDQLNRRFNDVKLLQDVEYKNLEKRVDAGDANLEKHIETQIEQIKVALLSADQLEAERIKSLSVKITGNREVMEAGILGLEEQIESVHRQIAIEETATKTAIQKADTATEKRFESVNEFRAQSADRERTQREQMTVLVGSLISRTEVAAMVGAIAEKTSAITDRINRNEGKGIGISQLAGWIFGGVGLLVGLIAIFVWLSSMQPKVERNSEFRQQVAPALQQQAARP